jgi:RNA polymerase sigma-70 factor (ECF subfamily)
MAFLVLLERLAPEERAAFLLREVFDTDYAEIARVLGKSEAAARQMVHRAGERVRGDRARFAPPPAEAQERLLGRFLAAIEAGDQDALMSVFAGDATFTSDGGGKVPAARRVLLGPERIARFLLGLECKYGDLVRHRIAWLNGGPAVVSEAGGRVAAATLFETDGERILAVFRVLNPDKLRNVR